MSELDDILKAAGATATTDTTLAPEPIATASTLLLTPEEQETVGMVSEYDRDIGRLRAQDDNIRFGLDNDVSKGLKNTAYSMSQFATGVAATPLIMKGEVLKSRTALDPEFEDRNFYGRLFESASQRGGKALEPQRKEDGTVRELGPASVSSLLYDVINGSLQDAFITMDETFLTGGQDPDQTPDMYIRAGEKLLKENELFLAESGIFPQEGGIISQAIPAVFDIGASIGLTMVTRSPKIAAGYMGSRVYNDGFLEARAAGKSVEESMSFATNSMVLTGAVEYAGGKFLLDGFKGSNFVTTSVIRAFGQGAEEGIQEFGVALIANDYGIRQDTFNEILMDSFMAATIGTIAGKTITLPVSYYEQKGVNKDQIPTLIENTRAKLIENQGQFNDIVAQFIYKEATNLGVSKRAAKDVSKVVKREIDAKEALIEEVGSAKALLLSNLVSEQVKLEGQKANLTLNLKEQRQEGVDDALANIKAQQEVLRRKIDRTLKGELDDLQIQVLRDAEEFKRSGGGKFTKDVEQAISALREAVAAKKKLKKPQTLSQFVRKNGGVKDWKGELRHRLGKGHPLIKNKVGKNIDDMAALAMEAGFFPERPTPNEFVDALSDDSSGFVPVTKDDDVDTVAEAQALSDFIEQVEAFIDESGVAGDMAAMKKGLENAKKRLKNIKKKESEVSKAKEAIEKNLTGSAPVVLADKLKTFLAGIKKGRTLQKTETKLFRKNLRR